MTTGQQTVYEPEIQSVLTDLLNQVGRNAELSENIQKKSLLISDVEVDSRIRKDGGDKNPYTQDLLGTLRRETDRLRESNNILSNTDEHLYRVLGS